MPPHSGCSFDDRITLYRLVRNARPQTSPPVRQRQGEAGGYWLKTFFISPTFLRAAPFNWSFFPSSSRSRLPERLPTPFLTLPLISSVRPLILSFVLDFMMFPPIKVDSPKMDKPESTFSPFLIRSPHASEWFMCIHLRLSKVYARQIKICCF